MMTKLECAIVTAYTGVDMGVTECLLDYAKNKMRRVVSISEFTSADFLAELKIAAKDDFLALCHHAIASDSYDHIAEALTRFAEVIQAKDDDDCDDEVAIILNQIYNGLDETGAAVQELIDMRNNEGVKLP